jgi:hypothetical protein
VVKPIDPGIAWDDVAVVSTLWGMPQMRWGIAIQKTKCVYALCFSHQSGSSVAMAKARRRRTTDLTIRAP